MVEVPAPQKNESFSYTTTFMPKRQIVTWETRSVFVWCFMNGLIWCLQFTWVPLKARSVDITKSNWYDLGISRPALKMETNEKGSKLLMHFCHFRLGNSCYLVLQINFMKNHQCHWFIKLANHPLTQNKFWPFLKAPSSSSCNGKIGRHTNTQKSHNLQGLNDLRLRFLWVNKLCIILKKMAILSTH